MMMRFKDWPPPKVSLDKPAAGVRQYLRDANRRHTPDGLRTLVQSCIQQQQATRPKKRTQVARTAVQSSEPVWASNSHPRLSKGISRDHWIRSAAEHGILRTNQQGRRLQDWQESRAGQPTTMFDTLNQLNAGRKFVHQSLAHCGVNDAAADDRGLRKSFVAIACGNKAPQTASSSKQQVGREAKMERIESNLENTAFKQNDRRKGTLMEASKRINVAFANLPDTTQLPISYVGTIGSPTEAHPISPAGVVSPLSRFTPARKAQLRQAQALTVFRQPSASRPASQSSLSATPVNAALHSRPSSSNQHSQPRGVRTRPNFDGRDSAQTASEHKPLVSTTMSTSYTAVTLPNQPPIGGVLLQTGLQKTPSWPPRGSVITTPAAENSSALHIEYINFGTPPRSPMSPGSRESRVAL